MAWVVYCVAACVLAWNYFGRPDPSAAARQAFYRAAGSLRFGMTRLELNAALKSGNLDGWQTLVIRTAFDRWRLRPVAPTAFSRLMEDYSRGVWQVPTPQEFEAEFRDVDDQWTQARLHARRTKRVAAPSGYYFAPRDDAAIALQFGPEITTADVGSSVSITLAVPPDVPLPHAVPVYWSTDLADGETTTRRRMARVESGPAGAGGLPTAVVSVDLSSEPAWLVARARAQRLLLVADGAAAWRPIAANFGDSELLPVLGPP